jgi:putative dimethyl sulfoxide reductase chaperone
LAESPKPAPEAGLEVDEGFRDLPDHIAAELELLYALLFREARAAMTRDEAEGATAADRRRRFVAMHLGCWVGEFAAAVRSGAETAYFRRLADLTVKFVAMEGRGLERLPRQQPPQSTSSE